MAFFTMAQRDGTIDKNIKMSEKEFERALLGMVQDSNAWERHRMKHKDAEIVPKFTEESDFDKKVRGNKPQQAEPIQYDQNTKHFTAGCNCGETFEINPRNFEVTEFNPMNKMKEMESYRRDDDAKSGGRTNSYGVNVANQGGSNAYGMNNVPRQKSGGRNNAYGINVSGGYQR
ncbi:MAG TPA: hypothetical protein VEC16_05530 [Alphaproteobacteria bacterium]|nr:hypothetical protein [Alphaproteobacteria bacterium]